MSPTLSRWLLATLVFIALGLVVSSAGLSTARWIMLGLLMLVFFFGGTSARRPTSTPQNETPSGASEGDLHTGEEAEDPEAPSQAAP